MPAVRCPQCGLMRWVSADLQGSPAPVELPGCQHPYQVPRVTNSPCYRTVRLRQHRLPGQEPYSRVLDRIALVLFLAIDTPQAVGRLGSYSFESSSNPGFAVAKIVIYEAGLESTVPGLTNGVYLWVRANGANVSSNGQCVVERM
jgi:hypothetical protein